MRWIVAPSLLVVLVAAWVGRYAPEVLLKVPHYGFILWALAGNPLPGYFDTTTLERADLFLASGDVVVSGGPKCGTNWMMTIVHELRTWNLPHLREFEDIADVTPWLEFKHFPGESIEERINLWGEPGRPETWNSTEYPFRVFKTHFMPKVVEGVPVKPEAVSNAVLPVRERRDVKFISINRRGEDVLCSLIPFLTLHTEEFRSTWGGFPPKVYSFQDVFAIEYPSESIAVANYAWLWWQYRDEPNVLLLHYTDVLADRRSVVKKIAAFLELQVPEEAIDIVMKRTSIAFMRGRNSKYLYRAGRDLKGRIMQTVEQSVIRSGKDRDCADTFSDQEKRQWWEHVQDVAGGDQAFSEWYENGGTVH